MMNKAEIEYGNDGRTPSLARGMAKGLPRVMRETWERNHERSMMPHLTNSRKRNYERIIEYLRQQWNGLIVDFGEYGKGKKREAIFTVLSPLDTGDDFRFMLNIVPFRDPPEYTQQMVNLTVSKHFLERAYQRFAHTEHVLTLIQLLPVYHFFMETDLSVGIWEIGTKFGMCRAAVELDEDGGWHMTAMTWVDKAKLGSDQPCEVGEYRMIESTE